MQHHIFKSGEHGGNLWERIIWHVLWPLQAKLCKKPVNWLQHQSQNRSVPGEVQTDQEMLLMPDDHEHWLCYLLSPYRETMEYICAPCCSKFCDSQWSQPLTLTGGLHPSNAFCCTHTGCEDVQHRPVLVLVCHGSFIEFTVIHRLVFIPRLSFWESGDSQELREPCAAFPCIPLAMRVSPRVSSCLLPPSSPEVGLL